MQRRESNILADVISTVALNPETYVARRTFPAVRKSSRGKSFLYPEGPPGGRYQLSKRPQRELSGEGGGVFSNLGTFLPHNVSNCLTCKTSLTRRRADVSKANIVLCGDANPIPEEGGGRGRFGSLETSTEDISRWGTILDITPAQ